MTRTSHARALFLVACSIMAACAALFISAAGRPGVPRASADPTSLFELYVDCDPSTGAIDATCTLPGGTSSLAVSAVIKNNSGADASISAVQTYLIGDNQLVFTPTVPGSCAAPALDCNPDFNQGAFPGGFNCGSPAPVPDADASPTGTESQLNCNTGSPAAPFLADGSVTEVMRVTGATTDGVVNFSFGTVSFYDDSFSEVGSCNPAISVEMLCVGAAVTIGGTPTNTPTPTDTFTPTNTPTPTDTPTVTPTPSIPDTDGDGLNDQQEALLGTNPLNPDTDADGLTDGAEVLTELTNPLNPDTDGDGLTDGYEVNTSGTNPRVADTDGDGLTDGHEVNISLTNPLNADTDGDGINDGPEINTFGTNPNNADSDADGLDDLQEIVIGTNPNDPDTDDDTLPDGQEVLTLLTSPLLQDTDGDLLNDATEVNTTLTDPRVADTDADGLTDGYEVNTSTTDPNDADTDDDGASDGAEVNVYNSNPKNPDTDGDTMPDGFEIVNFCLKVLIPDGAADPDLDFVGNLAELAQQTLPCNPDTDGDGYRDKPGTSHAHTTPFPSEDNCILTPNPTQLNTDGDFVELPPSIAFDDLTWPNSDTLGDACDPDIDNDGLSNAAESGGPPCPSASAATDPLLIDTDGDRATDGAECALGTDPASAASKPPSSPANDPDHDGLSNLTEIIIGTNPNGADSDGDKIPDGVEFKFYTSNPLVVDSDGDACPDGKEIASVNVDRVVNVGDQALIAAHVGPSGSPLYITALDINKDGVINPGDQALVSTLVGPGCPPA